MAVRRAAGGPDDALIHPPPRLAQCDPLEAMAADEKRSYARRAAGPADLRADMTRTCLLSATAALAAWAVATTAAAGPLPSDLPAPPTLVIPAGGCHGDVQTHYVPEVAGTIPHYHAGSDCRPIAAQGQPSQAQQDCHQEVRRHFVPGYGEVWHRHSRRSCRLVLADQPQQRDCHSDVRRHFVPGYGEIYHTHRGPNCAVVPYEQHQGPLRPGCFSIGPVTVCPPQ
jgi:hypothetical protein